MVELAEAPATGDLIPIADTSATQTKNITVSNLKNGLLTVLTGESIATLSDVDSALSPSDGDLLTYQSGEWAGYTLPEGGTQTLTANGAISSGDRVALNSDGTVTTVSTGAANSTDYFGIASAAISDTAAGVIWVYPGIATNQSSLTPSLTYYVDTDGTLTTSDTGTRAGRAMSATDLLIKP